VAGFTSPDRLRLQVFSTSWRLDPPHACWPYFMPDPLMGFALQSFPPPAQPYAVSGASALLPLKTPRDPSRKPASVASTEAPRQEPTPMVGRPTERPSTSGLCSTRESATSCRRVRPTRARSSPGLPPLQGFPPRRNGHGLHRASPHEVLPPGDESTSGPLSRVSLPHEVGLSLSRPPTLLRFAAL
jgi:hypothetical protein